MKKTAFYGSFLAILFLSACGGDKTETVETDTVTTTEANATGEGEVYQIVKDQSSVKWYGEKVLGKHEGEIKLESGQLSVANNQVTGGTIVMDMKTITNTDLTSKEDNDKLVGHLKSEDFFGVDKHPTATFEITSVSPIANAAPNEANYNVQGNLTIKEKTEQISFPATMSVEGNTVRAQATMTIDRSKFDVRYGSETFFGELGDKAISDDFRISFDVTATK
jgi:polyisoprenoid-binding protein YceI